MLRNPLADPFVLGVSGGASVMATLAVIVLGEGWLGSWAVPAWAFVGAMAAIVIVFGFGRVRGRLVPEVALLAGVILNALSSALIIAIRILASPQKAHEALYWLTGNLLPTETSRLVVLFLYIVIALFALMRDAHAMNVFSLGDETAFSIGIDVDRARRRIFLSASLLTAAAVAFAGPVGFVGIIVPHVARALLGPDHRLLVPVCALGGGAFVVLADTLARLSFVWLEREPGVGVVTALAGAPFFLAVLRRRGVGR
jgi:iron complex transport system permease protein